MADEVKNPVGRRSSTPMALIEARREYTVGLKLAGLSTSSIQKQVNALAVAKGWGEVSRKTVDQDIASYFRGNNPLTVQDYDHLDQMRQAHLAQVEQGIEKLALHISGKKDADWKPFEKADALEKLHKMRMDYAELQNWNLGRRNPLVAIQQNNINNIFDEASVEAQFVKPEAIQQLIAHIDLTIENMKEKRENSMLPDPVVIEGTVVEETNNLT